MTLLMDQRTPDRRVRVTTRVMVVALVGFLLGACMPPPDPLPERADPSQPTIVTVQPEESAAFITNPGMGWEDSGNLNRTVLPASTDYYRWTGGWPMFNPVEGVYDFSALDDALAESRARGRKVHFRIYTMRGEYWGGHRVPQWVLEKGALLTPEGDPWYANAVYQKHWGRFVKELSLRYDGHPDIAAIDISGYGDFGEWQWEDHQTEWDEDPLMPTTLDGQARRHLAHMFLGGSGHTVAASDPDGGTVTLEWSYPGFQETQLIMPFAGIRQSLAYVLEQREDVGWRYDCLGRAGEETYGRLGEAALERWRTAPVAHEFCGGLPNDQEVGDHVAAMIARTGTSLVHDNGTRTRDWLEGSIRLAGYRYVLDEASYPSRVRAGVGFRLAMDWRNDGVARAYPKMGQDFELLVDLRRADGKPGQRWTLAADVDGWLPGSRTLSATFPVPDDATPGPHRLRVGIRERSTGTMIRVANTDQEASGWIELGEVEVT